MIMTYIYHAYHTVRRKAVHGDNYFGFYSVIKLPVEPFGMLELAKVPTGILKV